MDRNRDRSEEQHGERQKNYRADERSRERDEIGNQPGLPEAAVGQSGNQPTGLGQPDQPGTDEAGMDIGSRDEERGELNRQEQGERDTEIRRETEFRNSTATPLEPEQGGPKVKPENDLFRREGEA